MTSEEAKKTWIWKDHKYKTIQIVAYLGDEENVIVPESIDGQKVTAIAEQAFSPNKNKLKAERKHFLSEKLIQVTLPDSLETIEREAFEGCAALKEVVIPDSVQYIWSCAFMNCKALQAVKLPSNLFNVTESVFENCSSLKTVVIQHGVEFIYNAAFKNCTGLEEIFIPSTVQMIDCDSFENCTSLHKAHFEYNPDLSDGSRFLDDPFPDSEELTVYSCVECDAHDYAEEFGKNWIEEQDTDISVRSDDSSTPEEETSAISIYAAIPCDCEGALSESWTWNGTKTNHYPMWLWEVSAEEAQYRCPHCSKITAKAYSEVQCEKNIVFGVNVYSAYSDGNFGWHCPEHGVNDYRIERIRNALMHITDDSWYLPPCCNDD